MTTHAHGHTGRETPPQVSEEIKTAARSLLDATNRLGPRITEHGYGCPAEHAGPCTCGTTDFLAAMHALGAALGTLPGVKPL